MLHSFQGFGALERGCHFGLGIEALTVDALEHGRCCGLDMGAWVLTGTQVRLDMDVIAYSRFPYVTPILRLYSPFIASCYPYMNPAFPYSLLTTSEFFMVWTWLLWWPHALGHGL